MPGMRPSGMCNGVPCYSQDDHNAIDSEKATADALVIVRNATVVVKAAELIVATDARDDAVDLAAALAAEKISANQNTCQC